MDQPIKRARGRPRGARGTPRRGDLEALWCVRDLERAGLNFSEALREFKKFAAIPNISVPGDSFVSRNADRTTDAKRLRRLAARYPQRNDLFRLLMAPGQAPPDCLPIPELCEGTQWGN